MSRNTRIALSVIALVVVGVLVTRGCHSSSEQKTEEVAAPETDESNEQTKLGTPVVEETPVAPENQPAPTASPAALPIEEDRRALAQKFSTEIHKLQACFGMVAGGDDSLEPNEENLENSVKPELGDVVAKNTDWTSSYIETPSGEKRLIRAEIDYSGDESAARKLKYFKVESDGLLTAIPMPPEQTADPSDALIASLETEGKITLRERSTRAYYANGGEVNYLEKDGIVSDIEVTYNGKNFRCTNLQSLSGQCRCF